MVQRLAGMAKSVISHVHRQKQGLSRRFLSGRSSIKETTFAIRASLVARSAGPRVAKLACGANAETPEAAARPARAYTAVRIADCFDLGVMSGSSLDEISPLEGTVPVHHHVIAVT